MRSTLPLPYLFWSELMDGGGYRSVDIDLFCRVAARAYLSRRRRAMKSILSCLC